MQPTCARSHSPSRSAVSPQVRNEGGRNWITPTVIQLYISARRQAILQLKFAKKPCGNVSWEYNWIPPFWRVALVFPGLALKIYRIRHGLLLRASLRSVMKLREIA